MRCLSANIPDAALLLLVSLLAPTSSNIPRGWLRLAEAVCTPALTHTNTKLTVSGANTMNVLFIPGTTTAVGITGRFIYDFDTTATTTTITPNVVAGNAGDGNWAGDKASGADARFISLSGTMKPDGSMLYLGMSKSVGQVTLSGNYPVKVIAGDQTTTAGCAEGDGTAARVNQVKSFAIADAIGDTVLVSLQTCHRLVLVQTNSPHTLTNKVGTGNQATATAAGYGTSASIKYPYQITPWLNRFYAVAFGRKFLVVHPTANWQMVIISDGTGTPGATANDIPFDNTYFPSSANFDIDGTLVTWSNCWLQVFQEDTQVGHIVDPEGGNMFLLAGIASPNAYFASADLNGNVWVSGHAGNAGDLGKYSIAYTGCPAMSPHKCKWQTATATLPQVPPRTRTVTLPVATPAPMTTAPATTAAVSSSASASSGGAATISAAATTAAATSAATTAVVGTTSTATAAAVTTTVATSTTAAAATSTSSSSGSTNGNGASSVTAAALGLVTMVLAMF